ncbi:unnamed protein product [Schistosoma curassoni]|uniref:Uncharacterized protein n=1 Tax=Schistosoma curassoni TaxID=6186 RepID=A0A183JDB8_9TREM|nr:unnamed protein product [Schistosoma curassoni]
MKKLIVFTNKMIYIYIFSIYHCVLFIIPFNCKQTVSVGYQYLQSNYIIY